MPVASQPRSAPGVNAPPAEIAILWLTAGLGCDGDTIAMTARDPAEHRGSAERRHPLDPARQAATIPSWPPKWATSSSSSFTAARAASSVRSSWWSRARFPTRPTRPKGTGPRSGPIRATGQPITDLRLDRPAGSPGLGGRGRRHLRGLRRDPRHGGQPHRRHGPARLPGVELALRRRTAHRLPAGLPGAAGQHDRDPALPAPPVRRPRAADPPRRSPPPEAGCSSAPSTRDATAAGHYEQGEFGDAYGSHLCIVKLGCWGPVVQCNVGKRGWMGGIGGCPNVGGICIGCTMPGFPDKFQPFMDQPPGLAALVRGRDDLRPRDPGAAPLHPRRR